MSKAALQFPNKMFRSEHQNQDKDLFLRLFAIRNSPVEGIIALMQLKLSFFLVLVTKLNFFFVDISCDTTERTVVKRSVINGLISTTPYEFSKTKTKTKLTELKIYLYLFKA